MKNYFMASQIFIALTLLFCSYQNQTNAETLPKSSIQDLYKKAGGESFFVQGRFDSKLILTEIPDLTGAKNHQLIPKVAEQWLAMVKAFEKEKNPNSKQKLFLVSTFRSYNQQKSIWESKYSGKKKMRVPVQGKSSNEIIDLILEFSSAPGTSRHHWGTDFDLNALENSYFEKGGKGEEIYNWLILNAKRFGFCQPYNNRSLRNNKGYMEEKWHWSYAPISNQLQKQWNNSYQKGEISFKNQFLGSDGFELKAIEYVNSINSECQSIK